MHSELRGLIPRRLKTPPTTARSKRPTILAVDDARTVRVIAQKVLSPFDCDVRDAANGYNALFSMEKVLPDLILLDVSMPIMDGLDMLTLMRSNPALQAIPVIMLTSPADHAIAAKLAALGIAGTVMKPFKPDDLLAAIRHVIDLKPLKPGAA